MQTQERNVLSSCQQSKTIHVVELIALRGLVSEAISRLDWKSSCVCRQGGLRIRERRLLTSNWDDLFCA